MIARSRLVGNFLSHCAVHRQLTRVLGLNQGVRFQSTNGDPDKNIILKLPPNATEISVEHSNEKSLDGTSLRVTLNISVLQSNKSVPESEQSNKQLKNLNKTNEISISYLGTIYSLRAFLWKNQREPRKLTNYPPADRTIFIEDLSAEISEDAIRDYFSRFGDVELCEKPFGDQSAYVTFKSTNAVKHVLNCAPHYVVGDRITNEIPMEEKKEDGTLQRSEPRKTRVFSRFIKTVNYKNRDLETKNSSQLEDENPMEKMAEDERDVSKSMETHKNQNLDSKNQIHLKISEDDIRDYFSRFGDIESCNHDFADRTTYITFKLPNSVQHVLNCGPYYFIDDKITNEIEPKTSKSMTPPKDELTLSLGILPPNTTLDSIRELFIKYNFCDNTILVKNLPKGATDEELQKIFSEFGKLTDWGVKSGGSYGWVSFARPINVSTLEDKSPTMYGKKLKIEPFERE
ncbi:RNA recognition motif domain-containing protein [Ditylenchus destructor]|nr:RNA recognition motif domain-containing protein [Ditylenchus destructor]